MKQLLVSLLVTNMMLVGCGSTVVDESPREKEMALWIGKHIDELVASWGVPDAKIKKQDGNTSYTWATPSARKDRKNHCTKTFVMNSEGIIQKWASKRCESFVEDTPTKSGPSSREENHMDSMGTN